MKINIEKLYVEFTPDSENEAKSLEDLWRLLVDCVRFNKKLAPMGEYVAKADDKKVARFAIEGEKSDKKQVAAEPEVYADKDSTYYCQTCNKYVKLKKNQRVPPCCGKVMEYLD